MSRLGVSRSVAGAAATIALVGGLVGCASDSSGPAGPVDSPGDSGLHSASPGEPVDDAAVSTQAGADADLRETHFAVTAEDAVQIATDTVGAGFVYKIELDYDSADAAWQWEIDILDGTTAHEIEIDAVSGQIVSHEQESTSDTEQRVDLADPMTYDEALQLAIGEVDGLLRGWTLEWDDGRLEYEFDLMDGNTEIEVTVDVETGQVRRD